MLTLENSVAELVGVNHAVAVNSGTSAIWILLSALGIGPGDEVIVPGFTFVASMSAIIYAGATPVLAEIDDTFNLDPIDVEARITSKTKAILAVHMLGAACDLDALGDIAKRHNILLIEDAAAGIRRQLSRPSSRLDRCGWRVQLQPVQDHHVRRRRHARHRHARSLRALLRAARPGSPPAAPRHRDRQAAVPGAQPADERALRRGVERATRQARSHPVDASWQPHVVPERDRDNSRRLVPATRRSRRRHCHPSGRDAARSIHGSARLPAISTRRPSPTPAGTCTRTWSTSAVAASSRASPVPLPTTLPTPACCRRPTRCWRGRSPSASVSSTPESARPSGSTCDRRRPTSRRQPIDSARPLNTISPDRPGSPELTETSAHE